MDQNTVLGLLRTMTIPAKENEWQGGYPAHLPRPMPRHAARRILRCHVVSVV